MESSNHKDGKNANVTFTQDWHWKKLSGNGHWTHSSGDLESAQGQLWPQAGHASHHPVLQPLLAAKVDITPWRGFHVPSLGWEKPASGIVPLKGRYSRMSMEWIWEWVNTWGAQNRSSSGLCSSFILLFQLLAELQHQTVNRTYFLTAYLMLVPSQRWPCMKIDSSVFTL